MDKPINKYHHFELHFISLIKVRLSSFALAAEKEENISTSSKWMQ